VRRKRARKSPPGKTPEADRRRVPFLGLTGGIGAGKSEALAALERLGAATLSTDAVVHELLTGDALRDRLVERLGREVAPGGRVDRTRIAERVFGDAEARGWLESLLWPRVGEGVARWRARVEEADPPPRAAVVEVPLLFESGMDAAFDHTIAVVAEEEVREKRAAARGHAGLEGRAQRQLSQDEKQERADFTVRNDGDLADLEAELSRLLAKIDA
jgi:dephospho-CoA kinase